MRIRRLASILIASFVLAGPAQAEFGSARARCAFLAKPIPGEHQVVRAPVNQALFSRIMLRNTNIARCLNGRAPLSDAPQFQRVAKVHSNWMSRNYKLSHVSTKPGWENLSDRLARAPDRIRSGRENLALIPQMFVRNEDRYRRPYAGSCDWILTSGEAVRPHSYRTLARYAIERLMQSPGHRENILDRRVTHHTATSTLNTEVEPCGTHFITQNFVELH